MSADQPLPSDTRLLAEEAYKFGVGPILVHSGEVIAETLFDNQLWLQVHALVANGDWQRHGYFVRRELYIRANASGRKAASPFRLSP